MDFANTLSGGPSDFTEPEFVSRQVIAACRYYLDLAPPPTESIAVVCGGREVCEPGYIIERRDFPFLCVEFVAQGEGRLRLDRREYRLRPGMVFSYLPGVAHRIESDARSPLVKYYVDFVGKRAARLLEAGPLAGPRAAQTSDPNELFEIFELLQRNGNGAGELKRTICASLVELLLLKITERAVDPARFDTRALVTYQRVRQHLEAHFVRLRTLAELAAETHVDSAYLCRLFGRFDQASPYQCLLQLKMNRAAELLLDRGLMVKEVAAALEFSDAYSFSRAFKGVFGLSPERFVSQGARGG